MQTQLLIQFQSDSNGTISHPVLESIIREATLRFNADSIYMCSLPGLHAVVVPVAIEQLSTIKEFKASFNDVADVTTLLPGMSPCDLESTGYTEIACAEYLKLSAAA